MTTWKTIKPVRCHCGKLAYYKDTVGAWICRYGCDCTLHGNGAVSYANPRCSYMGNLLTR